MIPFVHRKPFHLKPPRAPVASEKPKSAVDQRYAVASLSAAVGLLVGFKYFDIRNAELFVLVTFGALAVTNVLGELRMHPPAMNHVEETLLDKGSRIVTKFYALMCIYAFIGLAYFLFTGFSNTFVAPLAGLAWKVLLPLALLSPVYVWFTDSVLQDPHDELYALGCFITGQNYNFDWGPVLSYLRGWAIKAFFAPLMMTGALQSAKLVLQPDLFTSLTPLNLYQSSFRVAGWLSITYGALGYLCTFKLIRTHIRSADPTLIGWLVCILCYQPFWPVISKNFLRYEDGYYWGHLFNGSPVLWTIWGCLIIAAEAMHAWVTASFGMRFSNLTNRGILTSGPYRWMKHPSYVFKLMAYFLVSVPFISSEGFATALRNCLLLGGVAMIYVARAWTEERHLSADPDYVAYSLWMKENSLFAKLTRPFRRRL